HAEAVRPRRQRGVVPAREVTGGMRSAARVDPVEPGVLRGKGLRLLDERPVDPQRCRGRLPRARRVPGRVETRLLCQCGTVPHPAADDLERLDLLADARGEITFDVVPLVD